MKLWPTQKSTDYSTLRGNERAVDFSTSEELTSVGRLAKKPQLLSVGSELRGGRYLVLDLLGEGGEGQVYRVLDRSRGQEVALKLLADAHPGAAADLKAEFRFQRDLIHRGLVPLYELVVRREQSFFTMALLEGQDFLNALQSAAEIQSGLTQLLDVLSFLHNSGRVHRDIKPSNVLVGAETHLTLLDFGISAGRKDSGGLAGTPRYLAPELYLGRAPDPLSDAYAVGLMLYEAITDAYPFPGGRVNPASRDTFDPRELSPSADSELSEICLGLLEPDPEHRLSVDAALGRVTGGEAQTHNVGTAAGASELSPVLVVGREQELTRALAVYERSMLAFSPHYLHLEGLSGHGKSTLLAELVRRFGDEALVLRGRCSEHELVAHHALDGLLEDSIDYLLEQGKEASLELIPLDDGETLVQLFPELRRLPHLEGLPPASTDGGDEAGRRRLAYETLRRCLRRLSAREQLVLVIDDLQWADLDSARLLRELLTGEGAPGCLFIGASRLEDRDSSDALRLLFRQHGSIARLLPGMHLPVGPLSAEPARELFSTLTSGLQPRPSEDFVRGLIDGSKGSPLIIAEATAELRSGRLVEVEGANVSGGTSIERLIESRISRLSAPARKCLELLSVAGSPLPVRVTSKLLQEDLHDISQELRAGRLTETRESGSALSVRHDQFRETILRWLGETAGELHIQLADALIEDAADDAEVARHLFAAGDDLRGARYAIGAAAQARSRFAIDGAIKLLRLASLRVEKGQENETQVRRALADSLSVAGRAREAAPLYAELAAASQGEESGQLWRAAAEEWLISGGIREGVEVLESVQKGAGLTWPSTQAQALRQLLVHRIKLRRLREAPAVAEDAVSPRDQLRLEASRAAWAASFFSTMHGAANSSRYLHLASKSGSRRHLSISYAMEAGFRASAGTADEALVQQYLRAAGRHASTSGGAYELVLHRQAQGQCNYLLGRFQRAADDYEQVEERLLSTGENVAYELNSGRIFYGSSLFNLGRHRDLDALLSLWLAEGRERGDDFLASAVALIGAQRTALRTLDLAAVGVQLEEGRRLWKAPYFGFHQMTAGFAEIFSQLCLGNPAQALVLLKPLQKQLKQSHMTRVQLIRSYTYRYEAMACLDLASSRTLASSSERRELLARARKIASRLAAEGPGWSSALAKQLVATAELIQQPTEGAVLLLEESGEDFMKLGMKLHGAAVCARVYEVAPSTTREAAYLSAEDSFEETDSCDWLRALTVYAPRVLPHE